MLVDVDETMRTSASIQAETPKQPSRAGYFYPHGQPVKYASQGTFNFGLEALGVPNGVEGTPGVAVG